jgi:hypothetical protein
MITRGGTANTNLAVSGRIFSLSPTIRVFAQKEVDGFVRIYLSATFDNRGRRITFYRQSTNDANVSGSYSLILPVAPHNTLLSALPAAAGAADLTTGLLPSTEIKERRVTPVLGVASPTNVTAGMQGRSVIKVFPGLNLANPVTNANQKFALQIDTIADASHHNFILRVASAWTGVQINGYVEKAFTLIRTGSAGAFSLLTNWEFDVVATGSAWTYFTIGSATIDPTTGLITIPVAYLATTAAHTANALASVERLPQNDSAGWSSLDAYTLTPIYTTDPTVIPRLTSTPFLGNLFVAGDDLNDAKFRVPGRWVTGTSTVYNTMLNVPPRAQGCHLDLECKSMSVSASDLATVRYQKLTARLNDGTDLRVLYRTLTNVAAAPTQPWIEQATQNDVIGDTFQTNSQTGTAVQIKILGRPTASMPGSGYYAFGGRFGGSTQAAVQIVIEGKLYGMTTSPFVRWAGYTVSGVSARDVQIVSGTSSDGLLTFNVSGLPGYVAVEDFEFWAVQYGAQAKRRNMPVSMTFADNASLLPALTDTLTLTRTLIDTASSTNDRNNPNTWTADTEINFGDGTYGRRVTIGTNIGVLSTTANSTLRIDPPTWMGGVNPSVILGSNLYIGVGGISDRVAIGNPGIASNAVLAETRVSHTMSENGIIFVKSDIAGTTSNTISLSGWIRYTRAA